MKNLAGRQLQLASLIFSSSLVLLHGQTNITASTPKPLNPDTSGAGLLNEWLRSQSGGFDPWNLGGQLRVRYEAKNNGGFVANRDFARNLANNNSYVLLREKIHLGYQPANWLNFFAEARDASAHHDNRNPSPDTDAFDLHQAFIALGNPQQFPLALKIGRQELRYGDERFVGVGDWSNTGRSFDAAKIRFEQSWLWVDAFGGRVVAPYNEHFNLDNDYDWFSGIYASTHKLPSWQETQLFFLARNVGPQAANAIATGVPGSPSTARDVYTIGARVKSLPGKLDGWDYSAELAAQFGSVVQSGQRRDLQALAADATVGYTWTNLSGTPRLGAGYTYASGDRNPNDGKDETFEPLFGTNHKFYGLMDLWGLRNIHNGRLVGSLKPRLWLTLSAEYDLVWLADTHDYFYPESGSGRSGNGYGRNPQNNSFVGSELDVFATCAISAGTELQFGYGHFFTGDYIRESVNSVAVNGGAQAADWFYAQLKLNF